jgi:hypothetical protein
MLTVHVRGSEQSIPDETSSKYKLDLGSTYPTVHAYRHEQNKYDLHLLIFLMYPVYYLHEEKTEQVRKIKNDEAKNEHTKRFCLPCNLSF